MRYRRAGGPAGTARSCCGGKQHAVDDVDDAVRGLDVGLDDVAAVDGRRTVGDLDVEVLSFDGLDHLGGLEVGGHDLAGDDVVGEDLRELCLVGEDCVELVGGDRRDATLVGANTVNGPGPESVSTRPAFVTAVTRVEKSGLPLATATIVVSVLADVSDAAASFAGFVSDDESDFESELPQAAAVRATTARAAARRTGMRRMIRPFDWGGVPEGHTFSTKVLAMQHDPYERPPMPDDEELAGLRAAAEQLGVHYMTAYRYVRTGTLQEQQRGPVVDLAQSNGRGATAGACRRRGSRASEVESAVAFVTATSGTAEI